MNELEKCLHKFSGKRVLVVGDLMLDEYIDVSVDRISPEAPIPVALLKKRRYVPGGAANVANNVVSLGGKAYLIGVVGKDHNGEMLSNLLKQSGIEQHLVADKRPTTMKTRFIAHSQHFGFRLDEENSHDIDSDAVKSVESFLSNIIADVVVISDYKKGVITEELVEVIKSYAKKRKIPLLIDPKPEHMEMYADAYLVTPNKREAQRMSNLELGTDDELKIAGTLLTTQLRSNVLITRGGEGMTLFEKDDNEFRHIPAAKREDEVFDVSGAGDTVIATLGLAVSAGVPLYEAAQLANIAAGIKVGKLGTAPVTHEELAHALKH